MDWRHKDDGEIIFSADRPIRRTGDGHSLNVRR